MKNSYWSSAFERAAQNCEKISFFFLNFLSFFCEKISSGFHTNEHHLRAVKHTKKFHVYFKIIISTLIRSTPHHHQQLLLVCSFFPLSFSRINRAPKCVWNPHITDNDSDDDCDSLSRSLAVCALRVCRVGKREWNTHTLRWSFAKTERRKIEWGKKKKLMTKNHISQNLSLSLNGWLAPQFHTRFISS